MKLDPERLHRLDARYEELNHLLTQPETFRDPRLLQKYSREQKELEEMVPLWRRYQDLTRQQVQAHQLIQEEADEEMRALAEEEARELQGQLEQIEAELIRDLTPKPKYSDRNVIMEIRQAAGGDEAALFAADLYKMYLRYAEKQGWKTENMHTNPTGIGGLKEVVFLISGKEVYGQLRWESGVHRVQRVPVTESSGRTHTSTVTVAVLPEAEEIEVEINPDDLRTQTFHAQGAGGQHVNVTDSAVRIIHVPSGLVVQCQDERSQHQNKAKALRVLRAELLQRQEQQQQEELSQQRRTQIGTGDRSERIRTYNFSQGRVTDHRAGLTQYNLEKILAGELNLLLDPLHQALRERCRRL